MFATRYLNIQLKSVLLSTYIGMIIYTPLISTLLSAYSTALNNRYVYIMLFFTVIIWLYKMTEKGNIMTQTLVAISFVYLVCCAIRQSGFSILENQDFYGLILLLFAISLSCSDSFCSSTADVARRMSCWIIIECITYFVINLGAQIAKYGTILEIQGVYEYPHIFAYITVIIYSQLTLLDSRLVKILKIFCIALVLTSAVRSACLVLVIIVACDFIHIKSLPKKTAYLSLGVIFGMIIISSTSILYEIPVLQKTFTANAAGDVTNGRGKFVEYAMRYFESTSKSNQIFGSSMKTVRNIMHRNTGLYIHAHNDFVNILVGYGAIALFLIILLLVLVLAKTRSIAFILVLFLCMYYNGLYMYTVFVLCLPLVQLTIKRNIYEYTKI